MEMMAEEDELVISYDQSEDRTLEIIQQYEKEDRRIRVVYDPGHGVASNFNHAVKNCRGEAIFLSDQDDVWINDKINAMMAYFDQHEDVKILVGNGYETNEKLEPGRELITKHTSANPLRNYIKGTYRGCQMAFSADIKDKVWPVPVREHPVLSHDLWLGVFGSCYGKLALMPEHFILHRIHSSNYSLFHHLTLKEKIVNRYCFL